MLRGEYWNWNELKMLEIPKTLITRRNKEEQSQKRDPGMMGWAENRSMRERQREREGESITVFVFSLDLRRQIWVGR